MDEDVLRSELDQVTSELAAARIQHASTGARIAGLEAQQLALTRALAQERHSAGGTAATTPRYRTDAIVAVLQASGTEMTIRDVIAGLAGFGRPGETAENVRRGVYAAAPSPRASTTTRPDGPGHAGRGRALRRRQQAAGR